MYEESCPYMVIVIPFYIEKFKTTCWVSTIVVPSYLMYFHYM